jgi:small-conductance mechanosensitive channel
MFQVQMVRKDKKWTCKTCGSKQSIIKVFASSTKASEVRPIVQQLNMKRGTLEEEMTKELNGHEEEDSFQTMPTNQTKEEMVEKWGKYLDNDESEEETETQDDVQITTVLPDNLGKRKRNVGTTSKYSMRQKKSRNATIAVQIEDKVVDEQKKLNAVKAKLLESTNYIQNQIPSVRNLPATTSKPQPTKSTSNLKEGKWSKYFDEQEEEEEVQNNQSEEEDGALIFTSDF